MNIGIKLVPPGQITQFIPGLIKYLKKSEAWTRGRASIDDIVRFILTGQMNLWVFILDDKPVGHMITELKNYPAQKWLNLQYCAGEPHYMASVEKEMHDTLESFARAADCAGIEFTGRPGWKKNAFSRGYVVETCLFEKYL